MAAAPLISLGLTAAGTVSGMAAQSQQARAQRQSIEASNLAARQQAELTAQRLDYATQNANATYARQRQILDQQRDSAKLELENTKLNTELQMRQAGLQADQAKAAADIRLQELTAAAAGQRTQAAIGNTQQYMQLAEQLTGSREAANELLRVAAMTSLAGGTFDAMQQRNILSDIAAVQATTEAANTTNRVAEQQAGAIETTASIESRQANLMQDLYRKQLAAQQEYNDFALNSMPNILDLQYRRNSVALDAARYGASADLSLQGQANQLNLMNTLSANQARASAVQGPSLLGGLAQIGGAVYGTGMQMGWWGSPRVGPGGTAPIAGTNPRNTPDGRGHLTGEEYSGFPSLAGFA